MLRAGKLSPWVVFISAGFKNRIRNEATPEQMQDFNDSFDVQVWQHRLSNRELVTQVKHYLSQMGL